MAAITTSVSNTTIMSYMILLHSINSKANLAISVGNRHRDAMTKSTYRIQGETGEWEVVIGLEVHAQVTSNAKLFSGASAAFGGEPNSHVVAG